MELDVVSVKEMLRAYGYTVKQEDENLVRLSLNRAINRVKKWCNRKDIPAGLAPEVVSIACGEFFYTIKALRGLPELGFYDPNPKRVSQVTEGDTSYSMSGAGDESHAVDSWIKRLRNGDQAILEHYRKLDWWTR